MTTAFAIDSQQFRNALGSFTTGVTIVTTRDNNGEDVGLTANSFNSVSLDPPMVLWSLSKTSRSLPAFLEQEYFAVHILAADQEPLSNLFAKQGANKFGGLALERGENEIPLLVGCSARFQCKTAFRYEGGDHVIIVGEVIEFDHFGRPPLVFHGGKYGVVLQRPTGAAAPASLSGEVEGSFSEDFLGYLIGVANRQIFFKQRHEIKRRGFSEPEYYVLAALSVVPGRSFEVLRAFLELSGHDLTEELLEGLEERGYLTTTRTPDGKTRVQITEDGKRQMVELFAMAKLVEVDAIKDFDFSEIVTLKQLLRRLIRNTDPGLPDFWKKTP